MGGKIKNVSVNRQILQAKKQLANQRNTVKKNYEKDFGKSRRALALQLLS